MNNNDYFCNICNSNTKIDFDKIEEKSQILEQLHCHSFFIAKNHKVDVKCLDEIYKNWIDFFSSEQKFFWIRDEKTDEGFVSIGVEHSEFSTEADTKEFYASHTFGKFPSFIDTKATLKLIKDLIMFSEEIVKILDLNINKKEKILTVNLTDSIAKNKNHMLRVIHYPFQDETIYENAHCHTDACLFTVMPFPTCDGLEFLDSKGNWIKPKIYRDEVLFFNSDMIDMLTKGYLKSAIHRVCTHHNIEKSSRYSMPFFIHPNKNILLNKNLTAHEFLKSRLSKIGYDGEKLINTDIVIEKN